MWVLNESRKEHTSPKLQAAFEGPYVVAEKLNKLDYRVYKDKDGRRYVVLHHDKLKPYRGQHTPQWAKDCSTVSFKKWCCKMSHRGQVYSCVACGYMEKGRVQSHYYKNQIALGRLHITAPLVVSGVPRGGN